MRQQNIKKKNVDDNIPDKNLSRVVGSSIWFMRFLLYIDEGITRMDRFALFYQ